MKIIKYNFCVKVNTGTVEEPFIVETLTPMVIKCPTQAIFDANYPIAESEAYNGEITVEGEFDEVVAEPTQLDRVEAQVTYTAMITDTLLEV